jgi:predicted deacylase
MKTSRAANEPAAGRAFERVLGRHGGDEPGALVVCVGGIHGNEPAGADALRRVLQKLKAASPPFRGELLALAGNLKALAAGRRYLSRDLNRLWRPERVAALKSGSPGEPPDAESAEQRELLAVIEGTLAARTGPAVFLDLHTTSAEGAPFALISDTLVNRRLARRLPVPLILGLEENVEGTILNYINELGLAAIGFEGGQHESPAAADNHEAAVWLTLAAAGCLRPEDVPDFARQRATLRRAAGGLPPVLEVRYRHAIGAEDEFVMKPGFTNFTEVEKGEVLARDRRGEVRAGERSRVFLPLYQKLGEDGFFLVREVRPFWLKVSALLRALRLDAALPLLPGVRRHAARRDALVIDPHVARWYVIEICHLLGFRGHAPEAGRIVVSRRRQTPFT